MPLAITVLTVYYLALMLLCVYAAHRYHLLYLLRRHRHTQAAPGKIRHYPVVTLQIPLFNERYVVARLLDAVRALDYPREKLEIQILDDSTDDTPRIVEGLAADMMQLGFDIHHLRREDRQGYKAGALAAGMAQARGEFIAIFDADFCPAPDFLLKTLPYFEEDAVGMVQGRWGYFNRNHSLLTQAQAIFLDAHFMIEHLARYRSGCFFNFNGTAGIWRRQCLLDAGGWQADTLTEDLDISYRAQLAGWRFVFAPEVVAPSELPADMAAFRLQQHRWVKGSIQTARKLLQTILASSCSRQVKLESFFHLTNNFVYPLMILFLAAMLPVMVLREQLGWEWLVWLDLPLLLFVAPAAWLFYLTGQKLTQRNWLREIARIPLATAIGTGLALNNVRAVLEGWFGHDVEFRRTPKFGGNGASAGRHYAVRPDWITALEILFGIYFGACAVYAMGHQHYLAVPFMLVFQSGFLGVALASLVPHMPFRRRRRGASETVWAIK